MDFSLSTFILIYIKENKKPCFVFPFILKGRDWLGNIFEPRVQCHRENWRTHLIPLPKVLMQGNLFQRCTHFLYCSILSLGGKVNTRRTHTAWHGINFHKNNLWNILTLGNYYVNFQNYQNSMLLTSSDTRRTLMHLFLFTNSAWRELKRTVYAEYTRLQLCFLAL